MELGQLAQWLVVPLPPLKLPLQAASLVVVWPQAFGFRMINATLMRTFNSWTEARLASRRLMRTLRRLTRSQLALSLCYSVTL